MYAKRVTLCAAYFVVFFEELLCNFVGFLFGGYKSMSARDLSLYGVHLRFSKRFLNINRM